MLLISGVVDRVPRRHILSAQEACRGANFRVRADVRFETGLLVERVPISVKDERALQTRSRAFRHLCHLVPR